jgi:hypothetical protein
MSKERAKQKDGAAQRWPFDPMQPGDHEPVRLPDELERVQKPTGGGPKGQPPHSPTKQE